GSSAVTKLASEPLQGESTRRPAERERNSSGGKMSGCIARTHHPDRLLVTALTLALLGLGGSASAQPPRGPAAVDGALARLEHAAGAPVRAVRARDTGLVRFLSLAAPGLSLGPGTGRTSERAQAFLRLYGAAFGLSTTSRLQLVAA